MVVESILPNQIKWSWYHSFQKTMFYLMKSDFYYFYCSIFMCMHCYFIIIIPMMFKCSVSFRLLIKPKQSFHLCGQIKIELNCVFIVPCEEWPSATEPQGLSDLWNYHAEDPHPPRGRDLWGVWTRPSTGIIQTAKVNGRYVLTLGCVQNVYTLTSY